MVERVFLFPGYKNHFKPMVSRSCPVLGHNDMQECNVLLKLTDNEVLIPIDFEYGGWNPAAYDLGNYIAEIAFDNAHPLGNGIKLYLNNFPSQQERQQIIKKYMKEMHKYTE